LLGAEQLAADPGFPIDAVIANVNLDGNHLLFPSRNIHVLGQELSSLSTHAASAAEKTGLELAPDPMPEENLYLRSDHFAFVKRGIPAAFVIAGLTSADSTIDGPTAVEEWFATSYHRPSDEPNQRLRYDAGADYARFAFAMVREIANAAERPVWKAGSWFADTFGRERR
jgi:Zn-dependent M28 family amino/carboxypeptidase